MFSSATGAPRSLTLLCAIALLLVIPAQSDAQSVIADAGTVRTAPTGGAESDAIDLKLLVGRSTVVNIGQPIMRVSLTRPEIADVVVTGSQQLLVHGKTPGTISMFVWSHSGSIKRYDVTVARDLSQLGDQLNQLFPGESMSVTGNGKDVVISGTVSSKYIIEKAAEVAAGYVEKKDDVVNLLRQQEGVATNQVLLRVRFAEVSRSALTELGASFFTDSLGYKNYVARATTQQFSAPTFDVGSDNTPKLVFSDYLNLFLFNNKEGLGAVIRALQSKGLFQSLAEPNLVTENGKEASFLAGGEYPYPVVQGSGAYLAVTIVFKEYGIRLNFTPTLVGGDLVHLKVRPEVSSLDFTNAISYQGFRIPALSTRRADTEVELMDGQTFAIAGLLNNTMTSTMQKIPGIGDIPILGLLFRSKAAQKSQTELVVMITPQILRRGSMGAAAGLPNLIEPYLSPPKKTFPQPAVRLPGGTVQQQKDDDAPAPVAAAPAAAPATQDGGAIAPGVTPPVSGGVVVARPRDAAAKTAPAVEPAPAPAASTAPAPVTVAPGAPARAVVAPAASAPPPAPKIDAKKLAEERKAAEKAAERKQAEDRKAQEQAAKELKERQAAEGRELAKQRELDAKRREAEAIAAVQQKKAEARAAEEKRKADIKRAEEQVNAERARLALAEKQADEARKQDQKAAKERAKRDEEIAKQVTELQKKQVDAEKKRLKEIQEAVDRLNAAQAAYQAAVARAKKDGGEK